MARKKKKETKKQKKLEALKERVKDLEAEKQIEALRSKIERLQKEKRRKPIKKRIKAFTEEVVEKIGDIPEELDIRRLTRMPGRGFPEEMQGVRKPIDNSEKMWVSSMWENRHKLDPNFDPDNWFNSSVHLNAQRFKQIDDFWTGESVQASKNKNADDFWTKKSYFLG